VVSDGNVARNGDLLFSWSGKLAVYRWFGPEVIVNQHIFKVVPEPDIPDWFVEYAIVSHLPALRSIAAEKATTMGHIQRHHLADAKIACPPNGALPHVAPELEFTNALRLCVLVEGRLLEQTRDALLPKLISGRVRVPEGAGPALGPKAEAA
jgi:type I restriction enzyme S subunit